MTANTNAEPRLQLSTRGLKLRTAKFDLRAAELYGAATMTEIAAKLSTDKASLSLYRTRSRPPSRRFVDTVLKTFGGEFGDYFTYGEVDQ